MRPSDRFLLSAYFKYPPKDKTFIVFGSTSPTYESWLVSAGAAHVTTLEYNQLTYEHPKMSTLRPSEFSLSDTLFDSALSISSFDHDGLGRYGDPIRPDADLRAMRLAMCVIKPGGLLYLTIPIGPDVVVYNLHRRYGPIRLPLMLAGWEIVDIFGWDSSRLTAPANFRQTYEPVFVLRRPPHQSHRNEL
eukprot:m.30970 g.30970  ORF g.30970 m.30970 type:complete len:190 (+) comp14666_c0_seq1:321-890(+)